MYLCGNQPDTLYSSTQTTAQNMRCTQIENGERSRWTEHSCTEAAQSCSSKQRRWPRSWPRLGPWQRPCVVPVCRVGCQCPACRSTVRLRPNAAMCRPGRSPLAQHALLYTPFSCRKVTVGTKFLFLCHTRHQYSSFVRSV